MVPASIPLLAPGNPSNYLLDPSRPRSREWSVSSDGAGLARLGELVTPRGQQPRPSKHTIRVGEPRERERERERRDATAVRWAGAGEAEGAVTGPLGLSLPSQGQTRDQTREGEGDNLQICPWQCDQTSDNVQTPGWPEVRGLAICTGLSWAWLRAWQRLRPGNWPGPAFRGYPQLRSEPVTRWGPSWHVKFKVHNSHSQISNIVRCTLIVVRI